MNEPDYEMLFLKAYLVLSGNRDALRFDDPEYDDANDFLEAHKSTFKKATEIELSYGQCPVCRESCQPESSGYDDDIEEVCCEDCGILWAIVHTDKSRDAESWEDVFQITDIELM